MANQWQVFSNIQKSKYGLFKARIVSMANVASDWTPWTYCLAGDTTAPTSPLTANITLTNNLAGFRLQISSAWLTTADADICKIRWYVRVKANTNAETFSTSWQPTAILEPHIAFEYTPDTSASSYYDVWVLAQDIVGNYNTTPAAPQFDNEEATKIVNGDLDPTFTVDADSLPIATQNWVATMAFSATDNDTVAWALGVLTLSSGTAYNIGAGNTGNMTLLTYIYFDSAVSTTALQVTTTAATAIGSGKILIATAQKNTDASANAVYHVFSGSAGMGTTVMADNVVTSTLAAISANLGAATAGSMVITTGSDKIWLNESSDGSLQIGGGTKASAPFRVTAAGALTATNASISGTSELGTVNIVNALTMTGDPASIKGGQTAYDTGTGFFLGYNTVTSSAWKFSIGDSTGKKLLWNGATLNIVSDLLKVTGTSGYIQMASGGAFGSMGIYNNSPNALAFFQALTGAGSVTYGDMYLYTYDGTTEKSYVYLSANSSYQPHIILTISGSKQATIQLVTSGNLELTASGDFAMQGTSNLTLGGYVNAAGGYKDNGTAGIDWTGDPNSLSSMTISGGIITAAS